VREATAGKRLTCGTSCPCWKQQPGHAAGFHGERPAATSASSPRRLGIPAGTLPLPIHAGSIDVFHHPAGVVCSMRLISLGRVRERAEHPATTALRRQPTDPAAVRPALADCRTARLRPMTQPAQAYPETCGRCGLPERGRRCTAREGLESGKRHAHRQAGCCGCQLVRNRPGVAPEQ